VTPRDNQSEQMSREGAALFSNKSIQLNLNLGDPEFYHAASVQPMDNFFNYYRTRLSRPNVISPRQVRERSRNSFNTLNTLEGSPLRRPWRKRPESSLRSQQPSRHVKS